MGNIHRRRKCRLFADLIRRQDLRDVDDLGSIAFEVGDRDGAVGRAEIDAEAKSSAYWSSTSAGAMIGSRLSSLRRTLGSFTESVFQPRCISVPENGACPLIFPTRRYSS